MPYKPTGRKRGPPFKTHCVRGHDMSITRRSIRSRPGQTYCSECIKVGDFPSWRPSRKRGYELQRKYGLTVERWNEILEQQGGACAICHTKEFGPKGPVVDHCHRLGIVRGILALGQIGLIQNGAA